RYDMLGAARQVEGFVVDELSNWYIRRNRRRFWKSVSDADKRAAYDTLYACLVTLAKLTAPVMPFVTDEMYGNLVRSQDDTAPASVHLSAYPECDPALVDAPLEASMDAVIRTVELGRAARNAANLKVRQPLARVLVKTPTPELGNAVRELRAQVLDELNVKELEVVSSAGDLVEYTVLPKLPVLGPKFGKQLPKIRAALLEVDAREIASQALAGQSVTITVDGQSLALAPEELLIEERERPGLASTSEAGYVVALDTEVTPELYYEGLVRDFVRQVQNLRKQSGLNIDDRIEVVYEGSEDLHTALANFDEYTRAETLADRLASGDPDASAHAQTVEVGDESIRIGISRSA
ncbi:MAG: DUF5915 domain-containing protein, partial [Chloroflexota bacterium]|nr:DUF5915 domain-containing protein [Chloroflexota bacterium]